MIDTHLVQGIDIQAVVMDVIHMMINILAYQIIDILMICGQVAIDTRMMEDLV